MATSDFSVTVVIPVYKADKFIHRAVENILIQPEVTELILMEDGSPDNSLEICRALEKKHSIIKVFQHEGGVNRGAAATRNAGARHATNEFIAFADADNFYLSDRFKLDKEIFLSDPSIDGVYHAQGVHYEDENARQGFFDAGLGSAEFLSVSEAVPPEELLSVMLSSHPTAKMLGGLGIDAITLRRRCFDKIGYFSNKLKLQQDVYFFFKLAANCRMQAGNITEPVALRGVHGEMRSTDSELMNESRRLRWKLLDDWFVKNVPDLERRKLFKRAYANFKMRDSGKFTASWELLKSTFADPKSLAMEYGRFDLNYLAIFREYNFAVRALSGKNRLIRALKK